MNIITLNRVLLNNTPLNYRRKRILTEKDFYFKTIERTFTFSKSAGGKSIKDGRAYIKRIKGNSVVWNQGFPDREWDVQDGSLTREGETYIVTPTGGFPGIVMNNMRGSMPRAGDKVLILCDFWTEGGQHSNYIAVNLGGNQTRIVGLEQGKWLSVSIFLTADKDNPNNDTNLFGASASQDTQILKFKNMRYHNLTQMFGAGNEPSTIEEYNARKPIVADEYAYNEGEVIHCNTESIKSIGDNAWDEQWEVGNINLFTGENEESIYKIRSKNYIKILPNTRYFFRKPSGAYVLPYYYDEDKQFIASDDVLYTSEEGNEFTTMNAAYMRFSCTYVNYEIQYNNDLMLTLVHSGWKQDTDAGYQEYWQDTLPLPIIRKYFPQGMKSAGSAHDVIRYNKASGKWEAVQRIGSVDMGSLVWEYYAAYGCYATIPSDMMPGHLNYLIQRPYTKYANPDIVVWGGLDKAITNGFDAIGAYWQRYLVVKDSTYTDAASFKAAMQGVMLYYELAEPIVTELDAEDQNFRDYYQVADFGTEMSQSNNVPSAALLADVGYYFKKSEVKELTLN